MTSSFARARCGIARAARRSLAGCATQTGTVVLLPEKDGKDTAVAVKQGDGRSC